MIYKGIKKCVLYRGDGKPAELYMGDKKVTGYHLETRTGGAITFENTYEGLFDKFVSYGRTDQMEGASSSTPKQIINSYMQCVVSDGDQRTQMYYRITAAGLKVNAGAGNYRDSSGVYWLADEIDWARGIFTRYIKSFSYEDEKVNIQANWQNYVLDEPIIVRFAPMTTYAPTTNIIVSDRSIVTIKVADKK